MSNIASNIRYLRQKQRISQGQLACDLEMNRGNIASYEGGKALPGAEKLLKISNYFQVDISDLINTDLADESPDAANAREPAVSGEPMEEFRHFVHKMKAVIHGFREYHQMKKHLVDELPEKLRYLLYDYERLLDLMEDYQTKNEAVIKYVEQKK